MFTINRLKRAEICRQWHVLPKVKINVSTIGVDFGGSPRARAPKSGNAHAYISFCHTFPHKFEFPPIFVDTSLGQWFRQFKDVKLFNCTRGIEQKPPSTHLLSGISLTLITAFIYYGNFKF